MKKIFILGLVIVNICMGYLLLRDSRLNFSAGENFSGDIVIDDNKEFAYSTTYTDPGIVVKIRLSDFTRVGALTPVETNLTGSAIYNGYLYVVTAETPSKVVKIQLSDFTIADTLTLGVGENDGQNILIDEDNGFAYVPCSTSPGIIVKIQLSDFTRVGALTLDVGEEYLGTGSLHEGFLYVQTSTDPGLLVKVDLDTFTKDSTITLSVNKFPYTSVVDKENNNLYVSAGDTPSYITKIDLSTFTEVGNLLLGDTQNYPYPLYVDNERGFLYAGTDDTPGWVLRISLETFEVLDVLVLPLDANLFGVDADLANGFLYFATDNSPSYVLKINVNKVQIVPYPTIRFRVNMPNTESSSLPFDQSDLTNQVSDRLSWFPGLFLDNHEFKNGFVFTEYGSKAVYLKNTYTVGPNPLLEIVE